MKTEHHSGVRGQHKHGEGTTQTWRGDNTNMERGQHKHGEGILLLCLTLLRKYTGKSVIKLTIPFIETDLREETALM